ncbi:MAG TPA: acyltransferase [Spirochaetota bacterium]|nr:acyltransferase [Spirochaetota bacterium]
MIKLIFAVRHFYLLPFYYLYQGLFNAHNAVRSKYIKAKFNIHPDVRFWYYTHIYGSGKIIIHEGTYFGQNTYISSYPDHAEIEIGCNCSISHSVHIRTSDNIPETLGSIHVKKKVGNIKIGDNVWIGAGVYLKGGITIGNNVAIGANSVVNKSFHDNVVIGGVPVRIIRNIN